MALPKLKQPTYSIFLHSLKRNVEYRPYNVGEEKILMMISESKDPKFVATNMKKVISGCILDPDVNIDKVATYDIENLLLKIRSKSAGETVEIKYRAESGKSHIISIDLEEIDVTFNEDHEYKIVLDEEQKVGLIMKDLTFDKLLSYQENYSNSSDENKATLTFEAIIDCVESIFSGDELFTVGENTTREEVEEFISDLSGVSKTLFKFIETMPAVIYKTEIEGEEVVIKDIKSFLA